jgi:hypothetical protein
MRRIPASLAAGAVLLSPAVALGVTGCGDHGPHLTPAQAEGQAAVARRRIPQGITLSYTDTTPRWRSPDALPLTSAAAARTACGDWRAKYVAYAYGKEVIGAMHPADLDRTAHAFAVHEAAPGHVADVQRGCRAGLDTRAAR